ncbi:MAG TPA: GNAT family N-acetyltransferase [Bryobacteraceae bacterium]|nr:GNAT family N-acetyltransferase [Bryobacteraceae bacterium]
MLIDERPESPEDEPFLRSLIMGTVADELSARDWPEPMRSSLLESQYRARLEGLRANFPNASRAIVLVDERPAGWMAISETDHEIRLVDIVLLPEYRGQGIGTALIQQLLADSDRTGKPVRLTVRLDNRARRLYQRLGFRRIGGDELHDTMERPAL